MTGLTKVFSSATFWATVLIAVIDVVAKKMGIEINDTIAIAGVAGFATKEAAGKFVAAKS